MPKDSRRLFHAKRWLVVLRPLLMILVFMIPIAAVLIMMEALGSGSPPVDWSWVLYVGGALTLFAVLAFRSRRRSASREETDLAVPGKAQEHFAEEPGDTLDDVRRRIRQRKTNNPS